MSVRERDFSSYNLSPVGASNANLTLSALQLEACRPIRAGGNAFRAYCPFHGSDHQRSLRVNGDTGHFNCFACGAWGYTEEARDRWKEQHHNQPLAGPKVGPTKPGISQAKTASRPKSTPASPSFTTSPTPLNVVSFATPPIVKRETPSASPHLAHLLQKYQAALPGSWGEEYLRRRKIPLDLARRYGVGYAPPGEWAHAVRDWKFGRLVFPHTGPDGHLLNLYGRAVGSNEKVPKSLRHDHLQGEKGYFNALALAETALSGQQSGLATPDRLKVVRPDGQDATPSYPLPDNLQAEKVVRPDGQTDDFFEPDEPVFVCEGPFDALSLIAAGKSRAVAIFGVNGWRWEWTRDVRSLVFALDADETGQKSWRDLARQARLRGKTVAFLPIEAYGKAKDVNEAWLNGTLTTYLGTSVTGPDQATHGETIAHDSEREKELSLELPLAKNDPRLADPRPDLHKDSWLWKALFQTCLEAEPESAMYGTLHGLRCCGMRLRLSGDGMLKLGPSAELSAVEAAELEQNFLETHGRNLDKLLNRMVAKFKSVN